MRSGRASLVTSWLHYAVMALIVGSILFLIRPQHLPDHVVPHTIDTETLRTVSNAAGPELSGFWHVPPDVKICSDVRVSMARVETALRFWTRLGYEFGKVYVDESWKLNPLGCLAEAGEIVFAVPPQDLSFQDPDGTTFMAITRTYRVEPTSEIIAAAIYVQYEANYPLERIVEHELGHALGWLHHSSSYHIMHPLYV